MKLSINLNEHYYDGEILSRDDNLLHITLPEPPALTKTTDCKLNVTVGNVIYSWEHAKLDPSDTKNKFTVCILLTICRLIFCHILDSSVSLKHDLEILLSSCLLNIDLLQILICNLYRLLYLIIVFH